MESILNSTKKMLGLLPEQEDFDTDIIFNINSAFSTLRQLGVGPLNGFSIRGQEETFRDFELDETLYPELPMYLYYKTKLGFDPSSVGSVTLNVIKDQIAELEWRMRLTAEMHTDGVNESSDEFMAIVESDKLKEGIRNLEKVTDRLSDDVEIIKMKLESEEPDKSDGLGDSKEPEEGGDNDDI